MAQPYPISRESREEAIFFGDGGAVYGPFALKIFDIDDVEVWTKTSGGTWTIAMPTVAKVDPSAAFDEFTITFAANVALTTKIKVLSARVHERSAGITAGTKLAPDALEKELTKQGTILQELRRDIGRAAKSEFGATGYEISDDLADGDMLMKAGDRFIAGPNAQDIAEAQGYAAAAEVSKYQAATAALASEAAADAAGAAAEAAAAALAAAEIPPVTASGMLVDDASGPARVVNTFAQVNEKLGVFPTKASAAGATIDATITRVRLEGYTTLGDGLGGLYTSTNNGSNDTFTSNAGDRTWYRALFDLPMATLGSAGKILGVNAAGNGYALLLRREVLTADRTYYVRIDGSDSNNGLADTAGGAFLTGARALAAVASIDFNGYKVTVQFSAGTFSGQLNVPATVGQASLASLVIRGVGTTTIFTSTTAFGGTVTSSVGAKAVVENATITNSSPYGFGLQAASGGILSASSGLTYGACGISCLGSQNIGIILCYSGFTVTANSECIIRAVDSGTINVGGSGVIALGTRTVTTLLQALNLARIDFQGLTWTGAVTGKRYDVNSNAMIQTYGGGASFFPGSVAGTATNGGLYA